MQQGGTVQRAHYEQQDTEELLTLWVSDVTDSARQVLREVLLARGVSESQLVAIRQAESIKQHDTEAQERRLASRFVRLVAFVVDVFAVSLVSLAIEFVSISIIGHRGRGLGNLIAALLLFGYMLVRDAGIGFSLGKRLMGIRVVDRDSKHTCTLGQSMWRNVSLILTIDWLFIFGRRRARLGDMMANTIVVKRGIAS